MLRRRREFRAMLPIRAELIVFAPLLGIAQHFVGLVDLLELRLSRDFVLRHVGVMNARQFTKRLLDLIRRGRARHAQNFVIIFELDGHDETSTELRLTAQRQSQNEILAARRLELD